jgi:hypothetical protein
VTTHRCCHQGQVVAAGAGGWPPAAGRSGCGRIGMTFGGPRFETVVLLHTIPVTTLVYITRHLSLSLWSFCASPQVAWVGLVLWPAALFLVRR